MHKMDLTKNVCCSDYKVRNNLEFEMVVLGVKLLSLFLDIIMILMFILGLT